MANPLTTLARWFVPQPEDYQTRSSEFPDLEAQLAAIRATQAKGRVWRPAGVTEAMGVPAILGAVSLIVNTVGSLSMEAFRNDVLVSDSPQIPRLIIRPTPLRTPRWFWQTSAFYMATRGEFWWKTVHRDVDGNPDAIFPVPPWEIQVTQNDRNRLFPKITWLDVEQNNDDWHHEMYLPGSDGLRGVGPLQLAGAAVSVAVEADNWAGNFFSGSLPSMVGTTDQDLDVKDLEKLDAQWLGKANNLPRWLTMGMTLSEPPYDAQKAQLTESRQFQVGEVARMFSMPGALIEYQMGGSSLTYQNQADIWQDLQRRCLSPHYLEPMEQSMTDLLTRSTAARFNTNQLLRADMKTRYEIYESGVTKSGVLTLEDARRMEGLVPGNVDFAPVPFSPPSSVPNVLQTRSLQPVYCAKCGRMAGEFDGTYRTKCKKCGEMLEGSTALVA